jgi:hypothetical protein
MTSEDWRHAKNLIKILEHGEQEIPKSLVDIASRYEAMLDKRYTFLQLKISNLFFIFIYKGKKKLKKNFLQL